MTEDGYPTEEELDTITNWDYKEGFHELMAYIETLWVYADAGYWTRTGEEYHISTAGWSGNEEIIQAMQENTIFWAFCWAQSRRGGHYIFDLTRGKKNVQHT